MTQSRNFVLNPSNGYWGLSTNEEEVLLAKNLAKREKPKKCYDGIQVIALNTTNECNMDCIYCSTAEHRSPIKMPLEIAKKTIEKAIELEEIPQIVFHGSEPLLNMSLLENTVLYGEELREKTSKLIQFSIQSNLTSLTEDKLNFIREHQIGVSTSLDGRENEHNLNRPYRNGTGTYTEVREGIKKVLQFQNGMNVVCVVTKNNVQHLPEIVLDFEKIGVTEVQFLPAVYCGRNRDFLPTTKQLVESYIGLFEQTFERLKEGSQKILVRSVAQYLGSLFLTTGIDACRVCTPSAQHPLLAIDMDGTIYPCDFFWGDRERAIGNVMVDTFSSILNSSRNLRMCPIEESACKDCNWRRICGGGCMGDRVFSKGKPTYCEAHKGIFDYLSRQIDYLLEQDIIKKVFDAERERYTLR